MPSLRPRASLHSRALGFDPRGAGRLLPKVKRVAKKAALAAGVAAIGTALSELQPETKSGEQEGEGQQSEPEEQWCGAL
jgi:hypothetical protein